MEELRSTETLDREILEDARKKADRILKTADQAVHLLDQKWQEKLRAELTALEQIYNKRIKRAEEEIMARLPLDQHRLRSERAEKLLEHAAADFCASLSRDRMLFLMQQDFIAKVKAVAEESDVLYEEKALLVSVHGLLKAEADALLRPVFTQIEINYASDCAWSDNVLYPELICETTGLRLVVSFKAVIGQLLLDKRAELAVALLGGGVIND